MASRDASKPGDSDVISSYPANERAQRAAQSTIFNQDHFDPDTADQGKHRFVRLKDLGGNAAGGADQGTVFTKAINGVVELFFIDDQATVTQLTRDGVISNEVVNLPEQAGDPSTPTDSGNLYTKVFNGNAELFWQDEQGNTVRLTFNGELAIDLSATDLTVGSLRTNNFFRGRRRSVVSVGGALELDFETATVFEFTVWENTTVTFTNMPDTADGEEQTIYLDISNGGAFTTGLASAFNLTYPSGVVIPLTVAGRDLVILSTNDGVNIFVGINLDFK